MVPDIFKRYDIRGKYPQEIDEDMAYDIGRTAGTFARENFKTDKIVLGYDNRESSPQLKENFIEGAISTDIDVIDIGYATSDMTAYAGKYFNVAFSVCITASHLDWGKNGFKFRHDRGNGFLNDELKELKKIYMEGDFVKSTSGNIKQSDFLETYKQILLRKFKNINRSVDGKIAFDPAGGPSSLIVKDILERMGVEVIEINSFNECNRDPNPCEENLSDLKEVVREHGCDLGLANDVDADRLTILNDRGKCIPANSVIPIFAEIFGDESNIVTSIDAGRVVTESVENLHVCRVGDPFVSEMMLNKNAIFAAEPSGHYNYLPLSAHASGPFFSLVASSLKEELYEKLSKLPQYNISKENIHVNNKERVMSKTEEWIKDNFHILSDIDGIKFKTNGTHVLVRSSGTEDLIRIKAESKDKESIENIIARIQDYIHNELK